MAGAVARGCSNALRDGMEDRLLDDDLVTFGHGKSSVTLATDSLPATPDWQGIHDLPLALVTGTNGKTTTTRLIAAMASAAGLTPGLCSTEGVVDQLNPQQHLGLFNKISKKLSTRVRQVLGIRDRYDGALGDAMLLSADIRELDKAYIGFTRRVTDWRTKLQREMNEVDNQAIGRAVDSLLNYETVKYFGAEEREARRYDEAIAGFTRAAVKNEVSLAWLNIGQSLITNLMMAGAMGYTVWGWSQGRFTPGDVVLVNALLMQLFRPLDMLGWVYRSIRQGLIDMEAMFDLTDTPAEVIDAPGAAALLVGEGRVRFEDVAFGYEPERIILRGVTLDVPAGTSMAVVGPSGAGKSTLARLLYRFYDPTGGRITIDGQDIACVTQASLRGAIGIVPQDTVLFNDTIGYNIGYGREGSGQAEIEAAAAGAAIDGFIAALPQGYESMVGERGLKLSGGEKQRVAIARTLLKDPPILILDEATSALDSRTEEAIQATLDGATKGRTTIVIAHRLSTIVGADQIVVLDQGQVAERGTHGELLAKGGLYSELWMRQAAERELEEVAEG